ncbi:Sulfotransferase 4A1 [Mizuhopecten yessoensis]|uniref:Sulfotransferase 4A1 n=1 Tax=Mizuhopecten yessoensis TaxID=6573 RepID=A0A210R427_MIZYE|nr:Sulfotransferase 4A1 [Mizuhopecten yessoensis]
MIQMIRSETLQCSGTPHMLEFNPTSEIDRLDSPRTINTHLTYQLIPEMAKQGKVKVVHVLHNPEDTITPFFEFWKTVEGTVYEGDFKKMLYQHQYIIRF